MCTKSPTSAEHCALLTEGPARHGSSFANFHSFKLNSSCSYFSSAFRTGKEGHMVGQENSASCSAEDVCKGIWRSTAAGKAQLKRPTARKHGAYCSSLTWKWCRQHESTFLFVSACWENVLPASGALGAARRSCSCCALPHGWHGQGGVQGLGWSEVVSVQGCINPAGSSTGWPTRGANGSIGLVTNNSAAAHHVYAAWRGSNAFGLHPYQGDSWQHLFSDDFLGGLRRPVRWSPQTRPLVAFWKIQLFPCWKQKRGKTKSPPLPKLLCNESFAAWWELGQRPSRRRSDFTNYFYLLQQKSNLLQPFCCLGPVCQQRRIGQWWETMSFWSRLWHFACSSPCWAAGPKIKNSRSVKSLKSQGWVG